MAQAPGKLDERITVRQATRTADGGGGGGKSWSDVGDIWAHVEPMRSQERVIADQERGVTSYRVTVRNAGVGAQIATSMILVWRSTELNVVGVPNAGREMYRVVEAEAGVEV